MTGEMCDRRVLLAGLGLAGMASLAHRAKAGPIDPAPGPVAPTGRTTQEIFDRIARGENGIAEPRRAVQDLPSSPNAQYVISEPGSYYLTGDIQSVAGKDSILIEADRTTVDLCGYTIAGGGLGFAIRLGSVPAENAWLRVSNGGIEGSMRLDPASSGTRVAILQDLVVRGVVFGRTLRMLACMVEGGSSGGAVIATEGATIDACECFSTVGADIGGDLRATRSTFTGMTGLIARGTAVVRECSLAGSNAPALSIQGSGGHIDGNHLAALGAAALSVTGSGNLITRNTVSNGSPAYSIGPGNAFGPIVNAAGVGDLSAVAGSNHPWANFAL